MADYLDKLNEQDTQSVVQEPVVSMNVRQTVDFFDKHYDANSTIETSMPIHEGFDLLRARIAKKYEKDRVAPAIFAKYGRDLKYIAYKKNAHTTWYILFEETDLAFFVRHITNNHVSGHYLQ